MNTNKIVRSYTKSIQCTCFQNKNKEEIFPIILKKKKLLNMY